MELVEGVHEGVFGLVFEEEAGLVLDNGFEGAAFLECDNWAAAGHGFEGCDAEVFDLREDEGAGVGVKWGELGFGDEAEEFDVWFGDAAQFLFGDSPADDF